MSTENLSNNSCWLVLQDGRMGTDGQAIGLAHAMDVQYQIVPMTLAWWQRLLPPKWLSKFIARNLFKSFNHMPPGIIGAGRRAAYGLLAARQKWPQIRTIQIQNPKIDPHYFSQMVMPQHDGVTGQNVIQTLGGLHALNDKKLSAAQNMWQEKLSHYPMPRIAVLIGGNNKYTRLNHVWLDQLLAQLKSLHQSGHSLWITASRRTPSDLIRRLQSELPKEKVFFWDGAGDNPYHAFLAMADKILVTADSISMISEALYTDKPVALLRVPGENKKFNRFYDALISGGYTDWFDGAWNITSRPRLDETQRVAALLRN